MNKNEKIQNVFWTGGLDSTFRVLYLLFNSDLLVQPHYVIRHEESTGNEIDAMNNIRREVFNRYPQFRSRFLPTIYINEDLIPWYKDIDDDVDRIRKLVRVHEQYHILARYCRASNIDSIDLTYELDLNPGPDDSYVSYYFSRSIAFKSFRNPHQKLRKKDYYLIAKKGGWADILGLTSFCRRPRKKNKPCGMCGPCTDVVKNGIGFRLPMIARIRANILIPFRNFYRKNYFRHNQGIFKTIRNKFENKL